MLKKFGVHVLSVLLVCYLAGCTSEYNLATQKQESYLYGNDKEVAIGAKVSQKIQEKYKVVDTVDENERAQKILDKIVSVSDRQDIVYSIRILEDEMINAVSLPGGYIFLFSGLMDKIKNDDQLAGVIAHEVGHITAKHGIKNLQNSYAALALQLASIPAGGEAAAGVNVALTSLFTSYSQKAELEADALGIKYMKKAGYNPEEMNTFLEIIQREDAKKPARNFSYWRTHPFIPQRMANINREIKGQLEFKDYIKLIGTDNDKRHY
jgi:predicted Zn-dependent protease